MKEKAGMSGRIIGRKIAEDGTVTEVFNHNIITAQGDGMMADMFLTPPTKNRVDSTHGYMVLGTGLASVTTPKNQTWVYTQTGVPRLIDSGYPRLQGSFPNAVVEYKVTFPAGSLNASGINEACLTNGASAVSAQAMAYAQITPSVNISTTDTFELTWQITFLGT